jgi:fluoride ion exporter CrcB/FEX
MGGLTTYSTFDYETTYLFQTGSPGMAFVNIGATVVGCFLAGLLGLGAGHLLVGGE